MEAVIMPNNEVLKITGKFLVATDADGVIWDTVDECFHFAYSVFKKMEGEISADPGYLRDKFREGRFLAKNGDDFYIILYLIKNNPDIDFNVIKLKDLVELREKLKDKLEIFAPGFYGERRKLQTEDPEKWLSLQTSYPGVPEQLPLIKANFLDLVICTTKDTQSINMLLEKERQAHLVLGREFSTNKPEQMRRLAEIYSIPPDRILFIDDLLENLLPVRKEGTHVFMAKWGYNNQLERKKAGNLAIPLLEMDKICSQLSDYCIKISCEKQNPENTKE
jgi:phosphoglycolate phosphatase-like HAD superfamily hydrolase